MMNTLSTRISESLLEKVTQELMPDIPTHNKLARSWQEHEKSKLHKSRSLKKEVDQIKLNVAQTTKALAAKQASGSSGQDSPAMDGANVRNRCKHSKLGTADGVSGTNIPGFRYRANGDERKPPGESSRKSKTLKPSPGTSKQVTPRARRQKSSGTGKLSHDKLSASDNVVKVEDLDDEEEHDVDSGHKANKNTRRLQEEEAAQFRLRKVQEQLGLTRRPSQQQIQGASQMETSLEMEHLTHALKVLGFVLRDSDMEGSSLSTPMYMSKTSLSNFKPAVQYPDTSVEPRREIGQLTGGPIRERCEACRHFYRDDVHVMVKPTDPEAYKKPRWRLSPSGCYVPPPLKSLKFSNPALYNRTEELGSSAGRGATGRGTPMFPTTTIEANKIADIVSDSFLSQRAAVSSYSGSNFSGVCGTSAGVSGMGSIAGTANTSGATIATTQTFRRVSLDALKEKNNMEAELVKKKMQEFLESMQTSYALSEAHSAPAQLDMIRVENEALKFSGF